MARLNAVFTRDEFYCPQAVAIIRLLMLTGCRTGEIVSLEWDWIHGKRIHLPDSKSGPRTVWLSSAARAVIDDIPRYSPDCPFLFPARPPTQHIANFEYQWHRIRNEAGLPGLRLHDLRHNWASVAAMNGVDMVTVPDAARQRLGQAKPAFGPAQQDQPAVRRDQPAAEIGGHLLAFDGWKIEREQGILGHGGRGAFVAWGEGRWTTTFYPIPTTYATFATTSSGPR